MSVDDTSRRGPIGGRELATRGAVATVLSLVGNWLLLWIVLTGEIAEPIDPFSYTDVGLFTVVGVVGATIVYGAITRLSERPDRTFVVVAVIVLLLSFIPDIALLQADPDATVPAVLVLMVMHVIAAAACVYVLPDRFSPFAE